MLGLNGLRGTLLLLKSSAMMSQLMERALLKSCCVSCLVTHRKYNRVSLFNRPNMIIAKGHKVTETNTFGLNTFHSSGSVLSPWKRVSPVDLNPSSLSNIKKNLTLSSKAVVDASPSSLQPYLRLMRIDRPIGVWLVFLPCAWSLSLAVPGGQLPDPKMLTLFALGSFFMRGAGCIINDMWDKDFDSKVARTKDRPLASGELTRIKAFWFLSIPLSISLSILLTFNWNTVFLGACSMIPCIIYPLMKRVTYWPQAFLGITQNWGIMIAWSAAVGCLDWPCLALYLSGVLWTVTYDTIYSHQDKEDDLHVGVKSTALRFGDATKTWLTSFTGLITASLLSTGYLTDQTWPYYLGVAMFSTHLGHQIYSVNLTDPNSCGEKFRSNRNLGLIFWMMIMAANLLKASDNDKKTESSSELLQPETELCTTTNDSHQKQSLFASSANHVQ